MSVSIEIPQEVPRPVQRPAPVKLDIRGLGKVYPLRQRPMRVLDNVNLQVRDGEFVCIVGPSGCGKSTLFHIVAGLQRADEGSVRIDGVDIRGPGPDRVVVFQDGALFPWLTVQQNIEFGLKVQRIARRERERRVASVLQMMRLAGFKRHRIHQLSGGMRQRVAIARALVMRPKLLLMDEPFAALDAQTRNVLHEELQELSIRQRTTVLFITHNVEEATKLGDRVVVFSYRPGRILADLPIRCAHPRKPHDLRLQEPIHQVLRLLTREVEQATREERAPHE